MPRAAAARKNRPGRSQPRSVLRWQRAARHLCILRCAQHRFRHGRCLRRPQLPARARFFLDRVSLCRQRLRVLHQRRRQLRLLGFRQLPPLRGLQHRACRFEHRRRGQPWRANRRHVRSFRRGPTWWHGCSRRKRGRFPGRRRLRLRVRACRPAVPRLYPASRFTAAPSGPDNRLCEGPALDRGAAPPPECGGPEHCIRLRHYAPSRPHRCPPSSSAVTPPNPAGATAIAT